MSDKSLTNRQMEIQRKSNKSSNKNSMKIKWTKVECHCNNDSTTMAAPLQLTALQRWRVAQNKQHDIEGHGTIKRP
jgi:hypothetical protein